MMMMMTMMMTMMMMILVHKKKEMVVIQGMLFYHKLRTIKNKRNREKRVQIKKNKHTKIVQINT